MKYLRPESLEATTAALASGDSVIVGGGTMVIPDMTHRKIVADSVVDLVKAGLGGLQTTAAGWELGAMTTYHELERSSIPLLPKLAHGITGGPQIRHRGTVGGSACYANPASDMPAALVALDAVLRLCKTDNSRDVRAADYFLGPFDTSRQPDEVLVSLQIPKVDTKVGYCKFKLAEGSSPIVTATCVVDSALRVVLGGVAGIPVTITLEWPSQGMRDPAWRRHVRHELDRALESAGGPWTDVLSTGKYRARIAPVIAARAVADALVEEPA